MAAIVRTLPTVLYTMGLILMGLAGLMLVPLAFADYSGANEVSAFMLSVFITFFTGGALYLSNRQATHTLSIRSAFLFTVLGWVSVVFFSSLPYHFSGLHLDYTDSFFEAASGLTTTGSTVIAGLDKVPHEILVWRSMTQGIGGIGIVVLAMTLLPFLRVGGMQLYHTESSDKSDKPMAKFADLGRALLFVYVLLNFLCFTVYVLLGMSAFDAFNHALTTISTGGFSTHDASFSVFNPALQWACVIFMFLAGLPFILFIFFFIKTRWNIFTDDQVKAFLFIVVCSSLTLGIWLMRVMEKDIEPAFRQAFFNVVSVVTTTGYMSEDYLQWGSFPILFILFLTYLGACAGSTSGGIKMMRLMIVWQGLRRGFYQIIQPRGIWFIRYQGQIVEPGVVRDVMVFLFIYVLINVVVTVVLALLGLDFQTALSAAATAIANVGPGIGPIIGPAGNFVPLPDGAKWVLSFVMIIGRLEIYAFAVMFSPRFWKA